jgi:hypothetical protein
MKRQLTADQIQARDERRARARAIAKAVSAMPELERITLANKLGVHTVEGRELSLHNQCMIALQCPTASVVGGFRQWLTAGRAVCKGQHGIAIWVPIGRGKPEEQAQVPVDGTGEKPGFILGTVFDIGQTSEIETGRVNALEMAVA